MNRIHTTLAIAGLCAVIVGWQVWQISASAPEQARGIQLPGMGDQAVVSLLQVCSAAVTGMTAVLLGLSASWVWDTPSGPSIVVAATLLFAIAQLSFGFNRRA